MGKLATNRYSRRRTVIDVAVDAEAAHRLHRGGRRGVAVAQAVVAHAGAGDSRTDAAAVTA